MDELIRALERQARLYRAIDGGTGWGWDEDANNIIRAIKMLKEYRSAWRRIKRAIPARCGHVDVASLYMAKVIENELMRDVRDIEKSTLHIIENENDGRE